MAYMIDVTMRETVETHTLIMCTEPQEGQVETSTQLTTMHSYNAELTS